jgi:hypothetical protein
VLPRLPLLRHPPLIAASRPRGALCCNMLRCVATCWAVLQRGVLRCNMVCCVGTCCAMLQDILRCCNALCGRCFDFLAHSCKPTLPSAGRAWRLRQPAAIYISCSIKRRRRAASDGIYSARPMDGRGERVWPEWANAVGKAKAMRQPVVRCTLIVGSCRTLQVPAGKIRRCALERFHVREPRERLLGLGAVAATQTTVHGLWLRAVGSTVISACSTGGTALRAFGCDSAARPYATRSPRNGWRTQSRVR